MNLFYCGELRPTDGWGELGWTGLGQIGGERWRDGWMDGWMQEQGDDDGRSRGLSQGYGGGWQKIQLGAEGRWAVGGGRWAVGAVVPGWLLLVFRCGADGRGGRWDQTLGDSKTARIRGRAQSSMGTEMED